MDTINIKFFKNTSQKKLYRLSDGNNKPIFLKFFNVRLPFNPQFFNNNFFINSELFEKDLNYDDNISLINKFEDVIKNNVGDGMKKKSFYSIIKEREISKHLKVMLKRDSKDILLTADNIDIKKLSEYHKSGHRYDIVVNPEILWENDDSYGIIYYMYMIEVRLIDN